MNRRTFLQSSTALSAGMWFASRAFAANEASQNKDALNVGMIGAGAQGQVLLDSILKISMESPVHLKSICDIWEPNRERVRKTFNAYRRFGHNGDKEHAYVDYQEMLDKEKDLDAVIVATPDFWHAEHAIECMKRGLHVYCEKEMSNSLEKAREMVETSHQTQKLLQIGHQRRSNPKYIFCYENIVQKGIVGQFTTASGQWNRSKRACEDLGWPEGTELDKATLQKYGYDSMPQFRNWRWYKGLGGGPIVDLGSHQIDIFTWYLGCQPQAVVASGGIDYWTHHDWYDNVVAIFEYPTNNGVVRATYKTGTTNSSGGYYEEFNGDQATISISEGPRGAVYRESWLPEKEWYQWESKRLIKREEGLAQPQNKQSVLDVRATEPPPKYNLLVEMNKPFHQPHLENFFESVRGNTTLNCPGEIGYETAVAVLRVNEAVEAGRRLEFKPEDFHV
jgi:predicted dehydrogenase